MTTAAGMRKRWRQSNRKPSTFQQRLPCRYLSFPSIGHSYLLFRPFGLASRKRGSLSITFRTLFFSIITTASSSFWESSSALNLPLPTAFQFRHIVLPRIPFTWGRLSCSSVGTRSFRDMEKPSSHKTTAHGNLPRLGYLLRQEYVNLRTSGIRILIYQRHKGICQCRMGLHDL